MVIKKLKEIANVEMGLSPKGETYNNNGIGLPLLNGPTEFGYKYPHSTLYTTDSKREAQKGDIIFCVRGSTTGRMNFADKVYSLGRGVCSIRGKNDKETKYIKFVLDYKLKHLLKFANGGTFPNLCRDDILGFEVPYNNVEKVSMLLSNYDDLIENNNKRIKILEEMAQKIYKEWFVDFKFPNHETATFKQTDLGEIPSDWEIKKISEISTLSKGKSYKSSELVGEKEGLPFLNLKCVERDGGFRRAGLKWFDGKYSDTHVVMPEDIIMAVTDMTQERRLVARPARIPHNWYNEYVMSMDLVKLIANIDIDKSYFYCLLKYSNFSDEVKNHANGANVLHLNPQNIEQFELVVADKSTRDSFGNIVKQIYDEIDILYLKNETLKQTRDLLLPRLISGEIDVEDMEIV